MMTVAVLNIVSGMVGEKRGSNVGSTDQYHGTASGNDVGTYANTATGMNNNTTAGMNNSPFSHVLGLEPLLCWCLSLTLIYRDAKFFLFPGIGRDYRGNRPDKSARVGTGPAIGNGGSAASVGDASVHTRSIDAASSPSSSSSVPTRTVTASSSITGNIISRSTSSSVAIVEKKDGPANSKKSKELRNLTLLESFGGYRNLFQVVICGEVAARVRLALVVDTILDLVVGSMRGGDQERDSLSEDGEARGRRDNTNSAKKSSDPKESGDTTTEKSSKSEKSPSFFQRGLDTTKTKVWGLLDKAYSLAQDLARDHPELFYTAFVGALSGFHFLSVAVEMGDAKLEGMRNVTKLQEMATVSNSAQQKLKQHVGDSNQRVGDLNQQTLDSGSPSSIYPQAEAILQQLFHCSSYYLLASVVGVVKVFLVVINPFAWARFACGSISGIVSGSMALVWAAVSALVNSFIRPLVAAAFDGSIAFLNNDDHTAENTKEGQATTILNAGEYMLACILASSAVIVEYMQVVSTGLVAAVSHSASGLVTSSSFLLSFLLASLSGFVSVILWPFGLLAGVSDVLLLTAGKFLAVLEFEFWWGLTAIAGGWCATETTDFDLLAIITSIPAVPVVLALSLVSAVTLLVTPVTLAVSTLLTILLKSVSFIGSNLAGFQLSVVLEYVGNSILGFLAHILMAAYGICVNVVGYPVYVLLDFVFGTVILGICSLALSWIHFLGTTLLSATSFLLFLLTKFLLATSHIGIPIFAEIVTQLITFLYSAITQLTTFLYYAIFHHGVNLLCSALLPTLGYHPALILCLHLAFVSLAPKWALRNLDRI